MSEPVSLRRYYWGLLLAALGLCSGAQAQSADTAHLPGASIYRAGLLPGGSELQGLRAPDLKVSGGDAACTNCHRRSGLGEIEGRISIPPIRGAYLFHPRAHDKDDFDLPFVDSMRPEREPYTEQTLARAIREGLDSSGKPLNYLMPRYELSDADMTALIGYLKSLTPARVPGVGAAVLDFATIITPDADPAASAAMLDVLNHFFADKDAFSRAASARLQSSHRMMFKADRRWILHVWRLSGPPGGWQRQLEEHLAREPVFAVISGIGGRTWAPVHRFCEAAALPCLFPNVDLPVVAEHDFYSLYFSKGVLLEAGLMSDRLANHADADHHRRLLQVYRADDIGAAAARQLAGSVAGSMEVVSRPLEARHAAVGLRRALQDAGPQDVVVLWLRQPDLAALADVPVHGERVFISGVMGGLDRAPLPAAWRKVTDMAYPVDLPDRRRVRLDYPLGWFQLRQIPVVNERVQVDTYLACGLLAETLSHMSDSFIREYLVERLEGMLEHRILTAYYPRLALAPNQRFASKGGFLVRFTEESGTRVTADSDWIAP